MLKQETGQNSKVKLIEITDAEVEQIKTNGI
jgi:hypothetical protein